MLKVLDLFSGIGGFAYASERIVGGFETVGFCEIDPFCQKVLKKNFPNVPIYTDIKELEKNAVRFSGYVDVICGGFPCQPWSNAGRKEGHEDQKGRDLWPEMVSIIEQILPRFVIGENVRGFVNMPMGLPRSVNDLESIGYRVASFVIPSAYALGLPHRRDRCWIIGELMADTESIDRNVNGIVRKHGEVKIQEVSRNRNGISDTQGKEQGSGRKSFLRMGNLADGISQRLAYDYTIEPRDLQRVVKGEEQRADKLKSLGNSIIPQCASVFFQAIKDTYEDQLEMLL